MNTVDGLVAVLGLVVITVVTRGFFLFSDRQMAMPRWLERGLRHAPLAALVAVVAPEVLLTQGQLLESWRDPRLFALAAATLWYAWRRTMLGVIVTGVTVMFALRQGLGW
ncbi:MAG: hypothetical protein RI949_1850 [Pseudomonadota bacterium]